MPKLRKENIRKVKDRILILCEGEKTEPNYFNGIKTLKSAENALAAVRIEIFDTQLNTGKELVSKAKELKYEAINETNPYDCIWIVIDKDGYTKHPATFNTARENEMRIVFSSISFEYWFLLHFKKTTKAFYKADDLIAELKKSGYSNYDKGFNHFDNLKGLTPVAIKHAKQIRKELDIDDSPLYTRNPYTDVDVLVEYLFSLE
jgi:hypothetical protein